MLCEWPWEESEKQSYRLGKYITNHISERALVSRIYKNSGTQHKKIWRQTKEINITCQWGQYTDDE